MTTLIFIYAIVVTILYAKKDKENRINYSNFYNCLTALSETDSDLAKYLEGNNE